MTLLCQNYFFFLFLSFLANYSITCVNEKFRPAKPLQAIRKSNMFDSHYTILHAPIRAYTTCSNSVHLLLCDREWTFHKQFIQQA